MDRFVGLMLGLMAVGVVSSILLAKFIKIKWIWYIPSAISGGVVAYLSYKIKFGNLEGFIELGNILMIFMLLAFMIGNIITNIVVHFRRKSKNKVKEIELANKEK